MLQSKVVNGIMVLPSRTVLWREGNDIWPVMIPKQVMVVMSKKYYSRVGIEKETLNHFDSFSGRL